MAKKTIVQLLDDIDGGDADETVRFGLDGASYEIDLSDANAGKLRDALAEYVAHARRESRTPGPVRRGTRPARTDREQTGAIRDWARQNGYKIGDKGRIPAHIIEAFHASV